MKLNLHAVPWIAGTLAAATLAATLLPGAGETLQFDRTALATGEWWRLLTGHFTHWTADHLAWDLTMFVVLGAILERRSRAAFAGTVLASALAIGFAVGSSLPALATYRGLSGVDSALFVAVLTSHSREAIARRSRTTAAFAAVGLVGFAAKVVYEIASGGTFFVDAAASFTPVPLAHLIGGAVGAAIGAFSRPPSCGGLRATAPARAVQPTFGR